MDWITKEHREFKETMNELIEKHADNPDARRRTFTQWRKRLRGHGKAEEEVLFPTMMQNEQTRPAALEALEWHRTMRFILGEIMETEPGDELWLPRMRVARGVTLNHLGMEEKVALDLVRRVFEPELLGILGKDFKLVEEEQLKKEGVAP